MKKKPFRETALMRLGGQVSRFAGPVAAQDGYNDDDITERMAQADDDRLAPAWVEVVDRILRLERRVPQSHRTRSSLRWLRRWEVWIGEEMRRREAVPSASVVAARVLLGEGVIDVPLITAQKTEVPS